MSAQACIIFYGIRFELQKDEIEALEKRSDARLVAARENGLKHYWGNFDAPGEKWLLFIGTSLGAFGPEGVNAAQLDNQNLQKLFSETDTRLRKSGFNQMPKLYIQWQPDA